MEFNKYEGIGKDGEKVKVTIASGPIIIENGKVLVDKHGDDEFWKFPGGRQMDNLDFLSNAKMRVKEELGIDVELNGEHFVMAFNRKEEFVILVHYLAKRNGEIEMGRDVREFKWLEINNLPKDCAPNIKPVVEHFRKKL
tara:strand:- start:3380 stop:3799 length:420 start_codon:yes stop_codon:yes gene_type:complete